MKWYVYRLVLLAFFMRALVPVGFMLAPSEFGDHGFGVVICTSQGPQTLAMPEDDGQSQSKSSQDSCPFSTSTLQGYPSASPELSATVEYASVTYRRILLQFSATLAPSANSARGPPPLI